MNRAPWIVAVAVSFLVGGSLGVTAGVLISRLAPHGEHRERGGRDERDERGERGHGHSEGSGERGRISERLQDDLDLTTVQRERIEIVLRRARLEHQAARESMKVQIRRELTPEQRARWKEIESRFPRPRREDGPLPPPDAGRP